MDLRIQLLIAALVTITAILQIAKSIIELRVANLKLKSEAMPQPPKTSADRISIAVRILNICIGRFGWLIPVISLILLAAQFFVPLSKFSVFMMICSSVSVVSWMIVMLEERFNRLVDAVRALAATTEKGIIGSLDLQQDHAKITAEIHEITKILHERIKAEQGGA